ncbi:T9SS type A sorting domain-containing protein [Sphingobacteriales bacterium CHB3]|nr:T9SS type A sorting domain-containing protein [Sphingobacteriales bacterium CHB3]
MTMKKLVCSILGGILVPLHISFAQEFALDTLAQSPAIATPVSMAFAPGESVRFFFTEKNSGKIRVFENGVVRPVPFAKLGVTNVAEQGMFGIAVHPLYPDSPFVYVQYTREGDRANVVVRLRDSSGYGVDPRLIVLAQRVKITTSNNGGSLHFGPDGKLYCSFGDFGTMLNAQDTSSVNILGKILRLNPNGTIPPDNPFGKKSFWSLGHRNTVDFTFDPLTGKMYGTDAGQTCNNEVNYIPAGANLGWPKEGNCLYTDNSDYVRPLHYVSDNPAFTGIAVYRAMAFPRLRGHLLFAGNNPGTIWSAQLAASGDSLVSDSIAEFFASGSGFRDIEIGTDGYIYATSGPASPGLLLRLRPVPPSFASPPVIEAVQDMPYTYAPQFGGTPPRLSIVAGPDGMIVDSTTWAVHWTPANLHALQQTHAVVLRAENGAGSIEQHFGIRVQNVNDPPSRFGLVSPSTDTAIVFGVGTGSTVLFSWLPSFDPDLDTIRYSVQLDTVATFDSPALRSVVAGTDISLSYQLPRVSRSYYWRVRATDGEEAVFSNDVRRFSVTIPVVLQEPGKHEDEQEEAAVLEQNFPNPFNPTTNIVYTIPKGGYVRLAVFNLLGQEVARIFEGVESAGTYEVTFNKEELPTGIYFYRIQAPGFAETRKMIIAK